MDIVIARTMPNRLTICRPSQVPGFSPSKAHLYAHFVLLRYPAPPIIAIDVFSGRISFAGLWWYPYQMMKSTQGLLLSYGLVNRTLSPSALSATFSAPLLSALRCCDTIIPPISADVKRFCKSFLSLLLLRNLEVFFVYNSVKTAEKISTLIKSRGISVKRLEEMCELSTTNGDLISKIKRKERKNIDLFCIIAHVLNVSLDELIDNSAPYQLK